MSDAPRDLDRPYIVNGADLHRQLSDHVWPFRPSGGAQTRLVGELADVTDVADTLLKAAKPYQPSAPGEEDEDDPEIRAIAAIAAALDGLDRDAQRRVTSWAYERYHSREPF